MVNTFRAVRPNSVILLLFGTGPIDRIRSIGVLLIYLHDKIFQSPEIVVVATLASRLRMCKMASVMTHFRMNRK